MKARIILTQEELVKRINDQIEYKKQLSDENLVGNARCLGAISAYNDALDMTSRVSESATVTEAQSECEFCHDKYGNANTLKMYLEDTGKQYGEEEAYLEKIHYCEVCGRYLD